MNVLLVAIDTLRADHLGCYGYARPTSPTLDALAAEGARGANFLAPGIPTHPSFTTLFSGQHPIRHGVVAHGGRNVLDHRTPVLAELFLEKGYTTASFDCLPSGREYFARGFELQVDSSKRRGCGLMVTCEEINARLLPFLQQCRDAKERFFAFVHYWDPHTPYWAPPRYRGLYYQGDPCDPRKTSLEPLYAHPLGRRWRETWFKTVARDMGLPPGARFTDAAFVEALYDQEIRHVDDGLGEVFETLDRTGLAGDTLVVVLADHGECMTEHGVNFDHHGLYDENLHVPLLARCPGRIPAGRTFPQLVQHLDLLPTLCEAADLRLPEALDGKSAWGLLTGARDGEVLATELLTGECTWQMKWALRDARYHFILARRPDWYGNPPRELYDLAADPGLTRNLADERPELARELEARLEATLAARMKACGRERDPLLEHGLTMIKPDARRAGAAA